MTRPPRGRVAHLEAGSTIAPCRHTQDGDRPAERRDEPGRHQLFERVGCPAETRPDQQSAAEQQHQAEADAQDVAAGDDRQDRERGEREARRCRQLRPGGRRTEAVTAVADDGRARRQECVRRPADEGTAGSNAMTARRDPQQVAGKERRDETGGQRERLGQGIGQDRDADHHDDQPEDRGPRVPG